MTTKPAPNPTGKTSSKWYYEGYQASMRDIRDAYVRGGEKEVLEWLKNNLRDQ